MSDFVNEEPDNGEELIDGEGRNQTQQAIDEDGAEAICLGCAGMGPLDKAVERQLGVPVLDGVACAVKLVEALHGYGVTTSKVAAYKDPEPKELVACPGSFAGVYARSREAAAR